MANASMIWQMQVRYGKCNLLVSQTCQCKQCPVIRCNYIICIPDISLFTKIHNCINIYGSAQTCELKVRYKTTAREKQIHTIATNRFSNAAIFALFIIGYNICKRKTQQALGSVLSRNYMLYKTV